MKYVIHMEVCLLSFTLLNVKAAWKSIPGQTSQYQYFSQEIGNESAMKECKELQSHLVYMETETEAKAIYANIRDLHSDPKPYWIGLVRESPSNTGSQWRWSASSSEWIEGEPMTYHNFKSGESTQGQKDRTYVDNEDWLGEEESASKAYICEKEDPKTTVLPTTTRSTTTSRRTTTTQAEKTTTEELQTTAEQIKTTQPLKTTTQPLATTTSQAFQTTTTEPLQISTTQLLRTTTAQSLQTTTTQPLPPTTTQPLQTTTMITEYIEVTTGDSKSDETSSRERSTITTSTIEATEVETTTELGVLDSDTGTIVLDTTHMQRKTPKMTSDPEPARLDTSVTTAFSNEQTTEPYTPSPSDKTVSVTTISIPKGTSYNQTNGQSTELNETESDNASEHLSSDHFIRFDINDFFGDTVEVDSPMFTKSDERVSAIAVGTLGIFIFIGVLAFLLLLDFSTIQRDLSMLRRNLNCQSAGADNDDDNNDEQQQHNTNYSSRANLTNVDDSYV